MARSWGGAWLGFVVSSAAALGAAPALGVPAAAFLTEHFSCSTDGGYFLEGTSELLAEPLVLDHTGSCYPHSCTFTGLAETRGLPFPLPLALGVLSGQVNLGSEGIRYGTPCSGFAKVSYQGEVIHVSGSEARNVPVSFRSNGEVSATASTDPNPGGGPTAKAEAVIQLLRRAEGQGSISDSVSACQGGLTIHSLCADPRPSNSMHVNATWYVPVPAGPKASLTIDFTIDAYVRVEVMGIKYPPYYGGVDVAGQGSAGASIDPEIWIDPSWEYADEYVLEVSPGIGVPEPTRGVLLALGFAGSLLRSLRRGARTQPRVLA